MIKRGLKVIFFIAWSPFVFATICISIILLPVSALYYIVTGDDDQAIEIAYYLMDAAMELPDIIFKD